VDRAVADAVGEVVPGHARRVGEDRGRGEQEPVDDAEGARPLAREPGSARKERARERVERRRGGERDAREPKPVLERHEG
jgi:hypothetical protein